MKANSIVLLGFLLAFADASVAKTNHDRRAPEVPYTLQVEAGHKVSFHAYAVGV